MINYFNNYWDYFFFHLKMTTVKAFHKKVNISGTIRVRLLYLFEIKTISYRMKIWNIGREIRNKPEIIIWKCGEGLFHFEHSF